MVKIPDEIFRDRSTTGPLFTVIQSSYRLKKEYYWRQFDFLAPKRYTENLNLLLRIEKDLIAEKRLQRPIIYLDCSIPPLKKEYYIAIIHKFGATYLPTLNYHGYYATSQGDDPIQEQGSMIVRPTHIIAWDEEEHDKMESIQEEEELASKDQIAKLYFRTVAVVDPIHPKRNHTTSSTATSSSSRGGGGIVESHLAESKKKGGGKPKDIQISTMEQQPMALIHWWYWPTSYDEWVPANEVDDVSTDDHMSCKSDIGSYVVSCRFLRDVEKFNEWGCETDYAIVN